MPKNLPFYSLASFLIVLLTSFINKPDSLGDSIIFIISSISPFEIINVVIPDPNIILWTAASVADATANPYVIKILLVNGFSTFFIKSKLVFSNHPKSLPKSPPDYHILCNWILDKFILADELFSKAFQNLKTCV